MTKPVPKPLPARSAESDPLGKVMVRCETAVPSSVKSDMSAHWRLLDYLSESEYLRDLIHKDLYGSFKRTRSIAQRTARVIPVNPRELTEDDPE